MPIWLAQYFESRREVASVFVPPSSNLFGNEASIAILVKDAGMDLSGIARLENRYAREVAYSSQGPISVSVLNILTPKHRYRILCNWQLVFERNRPFRAWFSDVTVQEYLGAIHPH